MAGAAMPEPLVLGAGIEPIAGYTLVRLLGRGGFGEVWEASAPGDFHVALKFIRLDTNEAGVEQRSLDVIRNIRHPNLLDVQFATRVADCLIIAMPLCDESLMDRLRASPHGLPRGKLLVYMDELSRAVDYLNEPNHRSSDGTMVGVQHRDIKPHNIFLVGGSVRLADFGLAKILAATSASHTGSMSPHYVAPEVVEGRVSQRSDQYALAITYCQLRTGKLPFQGDSVLQIIYAHIHGEPDLFALPEHERPVVARALARRPEDRWPSCRVFVRALVSSGSAPAAGGASRLPETAPLPPIAPTLLEDQSPIRVDTATTTPGHRRVRRLGLAALAALVTILAALIVLPRLRGPSGAAPAESPPLARSDPPTGPAVIKAPETPEEASRPSTTKGAPSTPTEAHRAVKPDAAQPTVAATQTPLDSPVLSKTEVATRAPEPVVPPPPVPKEPPKEISSSIGVKLVLIPAGEFVMGSPDSDKDASDDEKPQHTVRITRPFYLGTTEVTQGQYRAITGENPSNFKGSDDLPVENISWNEAIAFCNKLSEREGLKPFYQFGSGVPSGGEGYRLPREAEWEYACRAGTATRFSFGDADASLGEYAWFNGNSGSKTHPVGQKRSNAWGLFDMHGNVWEWCGDGYAADYYKGSPTADPPGRFQAAARVIRGGSWDYYPRLCRTANRDGYAPGYRYLYLGFRLARVQSSW
jgi:formylglycine-generating enzyme required for sulfatase activity